MVISKIKYKDEFGIRLKHPRRKCTSCKKYPCFPDINKCKSNFAAYGCTDYKE